MINDVATKVANQLGALVTDDQISPQEVVLGAARGTIAFWMGCVQEGMRTEALAIVRQAMNEEIDGMIRGIANGMVPA